MRSQFMARLQHSNTSPRLFAKFLSHSRGVQVLSSMFSANKRCDLTVNSIIQHTKRNGSLLCQTRGRNPDFLVPTWAWVSRIRPNKSACSSSARGQILPQPPAKGGTGLMPSATFMFPFLWFAVLFLLWLGWPTTPGLPLTEAMGLPTCTEMIGWCVLNAALQRMSSY